MPAAMSFVQLEGNYVISFRSMNDCLPAFTAVKLDRRRGSWDGGDPATSSSMTNLSAAGAGPRRGSVSAFGSTGSGLFPGGSSPGGGSLAGSKLALGDDLTAAAAAAGRRKSSVALTPYKLVLTGVPRGVREDVIRGRLEPVIGGIERVYRDPDMARNLTHPPVFVETRSALAQEAFMLRGDWVPVVQRLIDEAKAPAASLDEGIGMSYSATSASWAPPLDEAADEERRRRQSLVDTLVACPHGRYHGQATCPLCRAGAAGRRNTMVGDDIVSHNVLGDAAAAGPAVLPGRVQRPVLTDDRPAAAAPAKKSSCASCIACFRRFIPGKRRPPVPDDDDDAVELEQKLPPLPATPPMTTLLDPGLLSSIKNQRRLSAYDDVPVIKVDEVDSK